MEVIELRSKHFDLNATREKSTSLFCFIFPMALLILKSQTGPACVHFTVVVSDRVRCGLEAAFQHGVTALPTARSFDL